MKVRIQNDHSLPQTVKSPILKTLEFCVPLSACHRPFLDTLLCLCPARNVPSLFNQLPPKCYFISISSRKQPLDAPHPPPATAKSFSCTPTAAEHTLWSFEIICFWVFLFSSRQPLEGRGQRQAGCWHPGHSVRHSPGPQGGLAFCELCSQLH